MSDEPSVTENIATATISRATTMGYGIGQAADGAKTAAFSLFLFFYFNSVLGLSSSLAGTAAMCALLVDGITDPMIGAYSDRFRSRWGRRHPFMLLAVIPFVVSSVALFSPPAGLGQAGLFAWMLGGAVAVRLSLTLFFVPHLSLGAEMVSDYHQRTGLIGVRTFFSYAGQIVVAGMGFLVIFAPGDGFDNGLLNPQRYQGFGLFLGVVGAIGMCVALLSTWHLIPRLQSPASGANQLHPVLGFVTVFSTLKQRSFRILFLAVLSFMIIAGVSQTLLVNVAINLFGFTAQQTGVLVFTILVGIVLAPSIAKYLSIRLDKRYALALCVATGAILSAIPFALYFQGQLQAMAVDQRVMVVFLVNGFSQAFFIAYMILLDSMISDCIDEHEMNTGEREEGLFFAARSLATKASFGFGALFAGIGLDVINFPAGLSDPSLIPQQALNALAFLNAPVLAGLMVLTALLALRYPLNAERHADIMAAIAARKASDAGV